MRLSIEHETHYRFGAPAHHSIQYLRLTPRADPCQSVRSWAVTAPGKVARWTDGYGNLAHVSVQSGVHDAVPLTVRGEIETFDTYGVLPAEDGLPPLMFLRPTPYTKVDEAIEALALPFKERKQDEGAIAALHALMWALHTAVTYKPGFTDVETTAAEALAAGVGVCQDHAHLFIACCRVLGIPARYVSGYLYSPEEQQALSTHGWAEAHIEDLGWVSFDASNAQCATDAYVRLAVASDYSSAAPVRGIRSGGGVEEMSISVRLASEPSGGQSQTQRQG